MSSNATLGLVGVGALSFIGLIQVAMNARGQKKQVGSCSNDAPDHPYLLHMTYRYGGLWA